MHTLIVFTRRASLLVLSIWLVTATSCGTPPDNTKNNNNTNSNTSNNPPKQTEVGLTYHKDVRAIIEQKCQGCHQPGQIGPFNLMTYKDVFQYKIAIKNEVKSRRMPPWKPDNTCNQYEQDFGMSDKDIKTLVEWIDKGAVEGKASTYKKPAALKPVPTIRADVKIKLPVAYKPKNMPDDYRCFMIDWPHKKDKFITGYKILAGNKKIAHHLIAFVVPPKAIDTFKKYDDADPDEGYSCYGGPTGKGGGNNIKAFTSIRWIGAWAPGRDVSVFPKGTGVKIPGGSKIILQMHYNVLSNNPKPDQSAIHFQVADKVKKEGFIQPFADPSWVIAKTMGIPAGTANTEHSFVRALSDKRALNLHGFGLHLHTRGRSGAITILGKDGKTKACGLKIPSWDFNWQGSYQLLKPIRLEKGEKIKLTCVWDNSAANQPVLDGKKTKPKDLNWGDGTLDEMCLGVLFITAAD